MLDGKLPPRARGRHTTGHTSKRHIFGEFAAVIARPWARVVLVLVFLEGVFLYGPFAFIATHVHQVFGLSLSAAGSVVMMFGVGGFVFALMSGRLVHRLGEQGLSRWGGSLMGIALLAIGVAPAWQWTLVACFVLGLGFYMLHDTLQVNATQMAPDRRGAAVFAFAACFFLGQSAGVYLSGLRIEALGTTGLLAVGAVAVAGAGFSFGSNFLRRRRVAASSGI